MPSMNQNSNRIRLLFTGDIGFDKYMDGKWADLDLLSEDIKEYLSAADHVIVNVEGPLMNVDVDQSVSGAAALKHSMNPFAGDFLASIGADVWNICNNHIMDCGAPGIESTLIEADKHSALTLGAGRNIKEASKPVIFNEAGGIGMIGVGYQRACRKADEDIPGCYSWSDMDRIRDSIESIKKSCRWCIVVAHGGEEFTALPSPYTRDRYLEYLSMGADIVVGHHPHVPNNYELIHSEDGDKAIFYSLGNFIFDTDYQRSQMHTEDGVLLSLDFNEEEFHFNAKGLLIDRNRERIVGAPLPVIFTNVDSKEYKLLIPLSTKMFIENTKKQLQYLKPDEFLNASEEVYMKNFYEPLRSGRVPGEILDMQILVPLAKMEESRAWKKSKLDSVKAYILEQI